MLGVNEPRMGSVLCRASAHRLFDEPRVRSLSGDAFRVFLWMSSQAWKYRDSDGKVKASASLISRGTGVSEATVTRSLSALQTTQLITRLRIDYAYGNLWRVELIAVALAGKGILTD